MRQLSAKTRHATNDSILFFILCCFCFSVLESVTNSDCHQELALELGHELGLNWTRLASTWAWSLGLVGLIGHV